MNEDPRRHYTHPNYKITLKSCTGKGCASKGDIEKFFDKNELQLIYQEMKVQVNDGGKYEMLGKLNYDLLIPIN